MKPKAFNKAMGSVIRKERLARGWSMETLGKQFGHTYQQQQKYEMGANGYSAQLLVRVADVFGIPVAELYERARINIAVTPAEPSPAENDGILAARYIAKIPSEKLRRNIIDFARKCAYGEAVA
jgi:transcriptional regulator with XRE-family HTH domain